MKETYCWHASLLCIHCITTPPSLLPETIILFDHHRRIDELVVEFIYGHSTLYCVQFNNELSLESRIIFVQKSRFISRIYVTIGNLTERAHNILEIQEAR
jgi:hypothetical protein